MLFAQFLRLILRLIQNYFNWTQNVTHCDTECHHRMWYTVVLIHKHTPPLHKGHTPFCIHTECWYWCINGKFLGVLVRRTHVSMLRGTENSVGNLWDPAAHPTFQLHCLFSAYKSIKCAVLQWLGNPHPFLNAVHTDYNHDIKKSYCYTVSVWFIFLALLLRRVKKRNKR